MNSINKTVPLSESMSAHFTSGNGALGQPLHGQRTPACLNLYEGRFHFELMDDEIVSLARFLSAVLKDMGVTL